MNSLFDRMSHSTSMLTLINVLIFVIFFFLIKLNTSLPIWCFIYPPFSTFTKGLIISGAVFILPYYMRFISCKVNCINCQYTQGDTGSMPEEKTLFKFSQHSINQLFI